MRRLSVTWNYPPNCDCVIDCVVCDVGNGNEGLVAVAVIVTVVAAIVAIALLAAVVVAVVAVAVVFWVTVVLVY